MGVRVQVCLRNAVSRALKYDGDAVDVECLVFEELPGDLPCLMSDRRYAGRMSRYQEDCENAGSGSNSRPYSQRYTKAVAIKKGSKQKRTSRSYDVFAGQNNSVRHSSIAGMKPFAKRKRGRAVDESTSESCHDSLCGNQMPDVSAERGQEEAEACKCRAAKSCGLASVGPSSGEQCE